MNSGSNVNYFGQVNPTVRNSRMRLLAHTFALELTMHVIDKLMNATHSHVLGRSPMHELAHANDRITEVFPTYQILPGLEKYTPRQLAFLSIARVPHTSDVYNYYCVYK